MKNPGILLVDLHGTLIPTAPFISKAFADTIRDLCPLANRRELIRYYLGFQGTPLEEKVAYGLRLGGRKTVSKKELNLIMTRLWRRIVSMPLQPYAETVADLRQLKAGGWKLFLSTDNPEWVAQAVLKKTGLGALFDGVLAKPKVGEHKIPVHVSLLVRRFKIPRNQIARQIVFYGDSLGEMQQARRAGILAIGRTTSYSAAQMRRAGAQRLVVGKGKKAKGKLTRVVPK